MAFMLVGDDHKVYCFSSDCNNCDRKVVLKYCYLSFPLQLCFRPDCSSVIVPSHDIELRLGWEILANILSSNKNIPTILNLDATSVDVGG